MSKKNLQVRLDEKLKRRVEEIFKKIGIDSPTAIRIFFMKVADVGGIPFLLQSQDDTYTPKQIAAMDRAAAQTKNRKGISKSFSSADELIADLRR